MLITPDFLYGMACGIIAAGGIMLTFVLPVRRQLIKARDRAIFAREAFESLHADWTKKFDELCASKGKLSMERSADTSAVRSFLEETAHPCPPQVRRKAIADLKAHFGIEAD